MAKYLAIVKTFLIEFKVVKIEQVRRDLNLHVIDLISAPNHEKHHESILTNTKLGPS